MTKERGVTLSSICVTCVMCALKVERLCSMLCSSPMSAKSSPMSPSTEPSPAGTGKPSQPKYMQTPAVLSATVLPPVFGPVMTRMRNLSPHLMSIGTDFAPSRGWRARTKENSVRFERSGMRHLLRRAVSESA